MASETPEVRYTKTVFYIKMPDGAKAYLRYSVEGDTLKLVETYTPPQHRGKGLARKMVEFALKFAEERDLKIEPICSYAVYYFLKNPDKRHMLLPKYQEMDLEELFRKRREEEAKKKAQ